jgi:pimeloyl-ACP methyl ester carboxylesterase
MAREQIGHRADDERLHPVRRFNLASTVDLPVDPVSPLRRGRRAGAGSGAARIAGTRGKGSIYAEIAEPGRFGLRRRALRPARNRPAAAVSRTTLTELPTTPSARWSGRRRKDVDGDRVAVVSHGEGETVAMLASAREKRIAAVGLLKSPGLTGARRCWAAAARSACCRGRMPRAGKDRAGLASAASARIAGSRAIVGPGAATPLCWFFKSWLIFDPAVVIAKIDRPLLILQGSIDMEVPVAHADRLEEIARRRAKAGSTGTRKIIVPGVNHLLVAARTGTIDEYDVLQPKTGPCRPRRRWRHGSRTLFRRRSEQLGDLVTGKTNNSAGLFVVSCQVWL